VGTEAPNDENLVKHCGIVVVLCLAGVTIYNDQGKIGPGRVHRWYAVSC